ncbi:eukaryotic translation initiation factor 4e-4 [Diplodia corticola]|uniref:Eukaryotic translation initiation factor 4e-4 n=1 Tax=Diplodia corticola TaxID=236234 RepID=A0A1J9QYA7_9PEZI|nr:eukaryotic translation initiation factor 4e-4 [Diplodia corticola]OJD32986.1 eukaryotic translation initiation factor 4e-4 [Diplodia corticola]
MDRDSNNLWTRRSNSSKLSLSMNNDHSDPKSDHPPRARFGGGSSSSHGGRSNPFNAIPPLTTGNIASPTTGASTAFGLGSGAFASFGSSTKTPKTPGTAFDFGKATAAVASPSTPVAKGDKILGKATTATPSRPVSQSAQEAPALSGELSWEVPAPLKYTWVIWYRPPTSKNSDYEKSTVKMLRMSTAQDFVKVFRHLKRPSMLPTVSDYHFFKDGIRPVWEDEENKKGGKWIMRLKKGVADRYWENLLMALIGNEFMEAGEEVCGAVVSVRSGEDVFSVWTKNDGGRNVKIRETIKRVLALPPDTRIEWKSHDDSIAQRTVLDQQRQEKAQERRRTLAEESKPQEKASS